MKKFSCIIISLMLLITSVSAQDEGAPASETSPSANPPAVDATVPQNETVTAKSQPISGDIDILNGYTKKFDELSEEIILAMIKDDSITAYKSAAAIRVFRLRHAKEVVGRDKKNIERLMLRRLDHADSAFVQMEAMHTLCIIDRYRYFNSMIPALIQKLDHHNSAVSTLAYNALNDLIESGNSRTREARVVFNTLRKIFFLSRKRLKDISEPDQRLSQKLTLLRWSIKVLGNQELERLPKEVLNLL